MNRPRQYLGDKRVDLLLAKIETCPLADWIFIRENKKRRQRTDLTGWLALRRSVKTGDRVTWLLDVDMETAQLVDNYVAFHHHQAGMARPLLSPGDLDGPSGPHGPD